MHSEVEIVFETVYIILSSKTIRAIRNNHSSLQEY